MLIFQLFLEFKKTKTKKQVNNDPGLFKMTAHGCGPGSQCSTALEAPCRMYGGGKAAVPEAVGVVSPPHRGVVLLQPSAWISTKASAALNSSEHRVYSVSHIISSHFPQSC
ncbi:hypothetical protein CRENBAI_019693 [Crenichthys baileyi]|uniref:Uncharacterized protein n=1 Tax=Crenichthys baileyi TaxID=28760 RepID=A0AAV9QYM2_9TELE